MEFASQQSVATASLEVTKLQQVSGILMVSYSPHQSSSTNQIETERLQNELNVSHCISHREPGPGMIKIDRLTHAH